jgi:hypothetical protein
MAREARWLVAAYAGPLALSPTGEGRGGFHLGDGADCGFLDFAADERLVLLEICFEAAG